MIAQSRANDPDPIHVDVDVARESPFQDVSASFGYTVSLLVRRACGTFRIDVATVASWRTSQRPAPLGADTCCRRVEQPGRGSWGSRVVSTASEAIGSFSPVAPSGRTLHETYDPQTCRLTGSTR